MCKNKNIIRQAIESAKTDTPEVYRINENERGLVGLVKVYNGKLIVFGNISGDGEFSYTDKDSIDPEMDVADVIRFIRRKIGCATKFDRALVTVAPCF